MRKIRWQLIIVTLAIVAIGVLLFIQSPSTSPENLDSEQPVAGGIYSEALIGSAGRYNPLLDFYNPVDYDVDRLLYSSLVRFDDRGLPHGDLAESWGISQDGKVYNFSIRPNAVWHDGQKVTSDDVIFTVELLKNDALPIPEDLIEFWSQIELLALDDKTIQFRLPDAFAPFLDYLTFGILPKHILSSVPPAELVNAQFNLNPIGSGPFQFDSLIIEDNKITGVSLKTFADYYGERPYLSQVIFRYYPNETAAIQAFTAGDLLGVSQISGVNLVQAMKNPKINLFTARLPRFNLIYLNLDDPQLPFFQDVKVRRALLLGLNRRYIIDRIMGGQAILANGPIFPENWAAYEGVETIEYDPIQAVELLKDAGYTVPAEGGNVRAKDGVRLSFELVYPEGEVSQAIANHIQKNWAQIGVGVELTAVPADQILTDYLEPHTYQAALAEINLTRCPDPDPYPFWHQAQITNGQNYSQWDERQVSEYLEQGRVVVDFSERIKRYRNFQVRFVAEFPALPLFYPVYTYGVDESVRGVSMGALYDPSDRFQLISFWYLRTGQVAQSEPNQ